MNKGDKIDSTWPRLAVSVVLWREGRVLLVRRRQGAASGRWAFPGGKVERGERLTAAAKRELFEETSIEGEIEKRLDVVEILERDGGGKFLHHFVLIVFAARFLAGAAKPSDDALEARFFRPDELATLDLTPESARLAASGPQD